MAERYAEFACHLRRDLARGAEWGQCGAAWELIVVDNGSTDGTAEYLGGAQDIAPVPVTVITNATNLGFPAAINQRLKLARGEHLVLLNNDVVVTDAWLDQLTALANAKAGSTATPEFTTKNTESTKEDKEHTIGLAWPMSNYAAPPQMIADVPYRELKEMHEYARRSRDEHRGQWFTVPKLSGFCLLMKRAVYDRIGGLDERFGLGFFDDDNLSERARRAGFELAVAHDLFVHHFGSRTFAGNGIDAERLLDENARRFAAKWGLAQTIGRRVALIPLIDRSRRLQNQIQDGPLPQIARTNSSFEALLLGRYRGACSQTTSFPAACKIAERTASVS
jgi:GT2 family glycosyltransferase